MTLSIREARERLRAGVDEYWFASWPPDLFALTTSILRASDAYRLLVSVPPTKRWPPTGDWAAGIRTLAAEWLREIGTLLDAENTSLRDLAAFDLRKTGRLPPRLDELIEHFAKLRDLEVLELGKVEHWDDLSVIATLNAVADEAGAYLDAPACRIAGDSPSPAIHVVERYHGLMLKAATLARIPAANCRVLPKSVSRTTGVTVRSLSRHLAVCNPLVEVDWRRLPVTNQPVGERVNILLLPWPETVAASDFRAVPHGDRPAMNPGRFGYFSYEPKARLGDDGLRESLDELLDAAQADGDPVEIVVLPELAVAESQVRILREVAGAHGVTLIVAGVQAPGSSPEGHDRNLAAFSCFPHDDDASDSSPGIGWGQQCKHHRWYLDASQIAQYQLGSALSQRRTWWERIDISRRRQFVLEIGAAPNSLVIAPLICEDLARQEPIGDLLRTLAPSLVLALLLDGPQLKSRWPGHYACVLADDPGSSVLTLTSLGMVRRSHADGHPPSRTIALWKDPLGTFREIEIAPEARGVLLRLRHVAGVACLADGREYQGSKHLKLEQVVQIHPKVRELTVMVPRPDGPPPGGAAAKATPQPPGRTGQVHHPKRSRGPASSSGRHAAAASRPADPGSRAARAPGEPRAATPKRSARAGPARGGRRRADEPPAP